MSAVVALASTASARHLDADLPHLLAALAAIGIDASVVDWDDPRADWSGFDQVVIRSTWDYQGQLDAYLAWIDHVAAVTTILNSPSVVRWNTDKRYLRDLAEAAISVIPTTFVTPGQSFELPCLRFTQYPATSSADASDTISMTLTAASQPLFPAFVPARSIACSIVSVVSTPKPTGTPVCNDTSAMPFVTSAAT